MTKESYIVASLLGDGYLIFRNKKEYQLAMQHSVKQEKYLIHKLLLAESLGYKVNFNYIKPSKSRKYPAIRGNIYLSREEALYYKHRFYPNHNKITTRHLLNKLDTQGLAIWYQDDGNLSVYNNPNTTGGPQRRIKLCTHGFTKDENVLIKNYFNIVWDIKFNVKLDKQKYYYIDCGAIQANKFFKLVAPYIHNSMLYKIDMKYTICGTRSIPMGW